jgi:hypothetical protein
LKSQEQFSKGVGPIVGRGNMTEGASKGPKERMKEERRTGGTEKYSREDSLRDLVASNF